ncbi:MAG: hypothetical protein WKF77_16400 [Planctomycetaceae bacterium]
MTRTSFVDEPAIAGQSVFMSTGAGGRSVLDAGLDLVYLTWSEWATVFADAGRDAFVLGTGTLDGPVHADRDVFVAGLGPVLGTPISAGRDAWIVGEGSLIGDVRGGQDAGADLMGTSLALSMPDGMPLSLRMPV